VDQTAQDLLDAHPLLALDAQARRRQRLMLVRNLWTVTAIVATVFFLMPFYSPDGLDYNAWGLVEVDGMTLLSVALHVGFLAALVAGIVGRFLFGPRRGLVVGVAGAAALAVTAAAAALGICGSGHPHALLSGLACLLLLLAAPAALAGGLIIATYPADPLGRRLVLVGTPLALAGLGTAAGLILGRGDLWTQAETSSRIILGAVAFGLLLLAWGVIGLLLGLRRPAAAREGAGWMLGATLFLAALAMPLTQFTGLGATDAASAGDIAFSNLRYVWFAGLAVALAGMGLADWRRNRAYDDDLALLHLAPDRAGEG